MNKVKLYGVKADGTKERVLKIDMGQSSTRIDTNVAVGQNSIKFIAFVDDKGRLIDIYRYFNPYRFKEDRCELDIGDSVEPGQIEVIQQRYHIDKKYKGYCECGQVVEYNWKFCPECGGSLYWGDVKANGI